METLKTTKLARDHFRHVGRNYRMFKRLPGEDASWYLCFVFQRKRRLVSAGTPLKSKAVEMFKRTIEAVHQGRMDALKGSKLRGAEQIATVGEIVAAYLAAAQLQLLPRTMQKNVCCLRRVLRGALGQEDVDGLSASTLDATLVGRFQAARLRAAAGTDALRRNSAAVSANADLRNARALFSRKAIERGIYTSLTLPDLGGFCRARKLDELRCDHYDLPDGPMLLKIWTGSTALKEKRPDVWMAFWIAAMAGLRQGEIVYMRWRWFRPGAIRVCFEADYIPKGKRERETPVVERVEIEARAAAAAAGWATGPEDYVLPGPLTRRQNVFRALGEWLKSLGWTRRQKAHELRKIFASHLAAQEGGAYAAQLALGHQDIKTTMRYAARPPLRPVDVGLVSLAQE